MARGKKKQPKLSAFDEDVLTVLLGRELYGLEILDQLNLDRPDELMFSSLYPALNRLEKKGFVSWRWGDETDTSGGARRKYYKVNGVGEAGLKQVQEYRTALAQRAVQGRMPLSYPFWTGSNQHYFVAIAISLTLNLAAFVQGQKAMEGASYV